jgi:hypothetical protein
MNRIAMDYEHFEREIDRFGDLLRNASSDLQKVFEELDVLNGQWEGPAHSAFVGNVLADKIFTMKVLGDLAKYKYLLEQTKQIYIRREAGIQSVVEELQ